MNTRVQGDNKSVIDYVLVNQRMYGQILNIEIDENKETFDLLDHCIVDCHWWNKRYRGNSKEEGGSGILKIKG